MATSPVHSRSASFFQNAALVGNIASKGGNGAHGKEGGTLLQTRASRLEIRPRDWTLGSLRADLGSLRSSRGWESCARPRVTGLPSPLPQALEQGTFPIGQGHTGSCPRPSSQCGQPLPGPRMEKSGPPSTAPRPQAEPYSPRALASITGPATAHLWPSWRPSFRPAGTPAPQKVCRPPALS